MAGSSGCPAFFVICMQVWKWEKKIATLLGDADDADLSARLLLRHALEFDDLTYSLNLHREVTEKELRKLFPDVLRRQKGEPMAYILGHKEFYSNDFIVTPATLIPRPETELLVDLALDLIRRDDARIADIGCGTGCIGISLALERPFWTPFLMDKSSDALAVACGNASRFSLNLPCILADMAFLPFDNSSLDLIISNPPYIDEQKPEETASDVLAFEPHLALFSPNAGLWHIEALASQARRILKPGGLLVLEHGYEQGEKTMDIFRRYGLKIIGDFQDLAGLSRCCIGKKI